MNVKLHTPSTLKAGSGLASSKQFILSIFATTISIVLTFGTAGIIDYNKKQSAKKEMVKMIIYDFDKTIEQVEKIDTALFDAMRKQHEIALHPEYYDSLRFILKPIVEVMYMEFPETTEKIFSTSIETFNTIGDVNFVNEVSSFYMTRHKYKELMLDQLSEDLEKNPVAQSLESLLEISFPDYAYFSWYFLRDMKKYRDDCMKMMKVSEKEMSEFSKRQMVKTDTQEHDSINLKMMQEYEKSIDALYQAREKLK